MQIESEVEQGEPWYLEEPLALIPHRDHKYPSYQEYVMEKNWMPFIYKVHRALLHCHIGMAQFLTTPCRAYDVMKRVKVNI